jgi:hypothetical protein
MSIYVGMDVHRKREGCAKSMWPVTCWFMSDGSSVC